MKKEDVYQIKDDIFIAVVRESTNIHSALQKMGLNSRGAAYKTFKRRCKILNLDISHFMKDSEIRKQISEEQIKIAVEANISRQSVLKDLKLNPHIGSNITWINKKIINLNIKNDHWLGEAHLKNKTHSWANSIPLEDILIENSSYTSSSLKRRLIKDGLLIYKCNECEISEWKNKTIILQLEHKNGNNTDNRLENLCLLCPNCHSQTKTFAGRNIGRNGRT